MKLKYNLPSTLSYTFYLPKHEKEMRERRGSTSQHTIYIEPNSSLFSIPPTSYNIPPPLSHLSSPLPSLLSFHMNQTYSTGFNILQIVHYRWLQVHRKLVVPGLQLTAWPRQLSSETSKMRGKAVSGKAIFVLCVATFLAGSLFSSRTWNLHPDITSDGRGVNHDCDHKRKLVETNTRDIMGEVKKTHVAIQSLEKTISALEMELAVSRTSRSGSKTTAEGSDSLKKAFVVIGINTAFSSRKRRDSLRETWMPKGDELKKVEKEKGIILRFVIGHSATPGGVLDRAIDDEEAEYKDFLRLNHVEGYHELSTKTRIYFSTAFSIWDAEFYVKVDDDVHLNLGTLATTLARHRSKPRVYIGCMKSGPVLSRKGVKYHEPEFWKFGEEGNKYFRHATGQIYAISKDLAAYISINSGILHRYANEDVSLGAWLIGLEVEHVDERSMCCGTSPDEMSDCEWRAKAGNVCVASFDWSCSGICKSVERMKQVHHSCGEGEGAVWSINM